MSAGVAPGPTPVAASPSRPGKAAPVLRRRLAILERAWPWVLVTLVAGGALWVVMAVAISGDAPQDFRGHTAPGLLMAALAVAMTLLALFYSLRKRALQERLGLGAGTMMMWLGLHAALGLLALLAAVLHGGYGILSPSWSTGKALFIVFALLVLSGLAWRLIYRVVPPIAAPRIGNYSQVGSASRADVQLLEIEKLAAGKSPQFHQLKAWILDQAPSQHEVMQASASLPDPAERAVVPELWRLVESQGRALGRARLQARFTRLLQAWRLVHIPLTLLVVPLLALHIVGALYLPARVMPLGTVPFGSLSGFSRATECRTCHRAIYDQWATSMHAHALTSPATIAQNNQLVRIELGNQTAPDPQRFCVNCHGPVPAALTSDAKLPLSRLEYDGALLNEGVSCSSCHQYGGGSVPGAAGASAFQGDLVPGPTYFGNLEHPTGNAFHQSLDTPTHKQPQTLCTNCHNVLYDRNHDGRIEKAVDLVLQTTSEEYDEYVAEGGAGTCVSCHMPIVPGKNRVAEKALIPAEQDAAAPPRKLHDHAFVGVDYPLDTVHVKDPHKDAREALLRSAARLDLDPQTIAIAGNNVTFKVGITNTGAGHNLPTGFAFARQMWLEVKVSDPSGAVLFSSGLVGNTVTDLCDASTLDDENNPVLPHVLGCSASDPQLVNIQGKLVDKTEPKKDKNGELVRNEKGELVNAQTEDGEETWLQRLGGGVVARIRPSDKQALGTIPPNDTRTFGYKVPLGVRPSAVTISVRLLFRNMPPYFLRALAANQPADEKPKLGTFIPNLQVVEMASRRETVPVR